jgi:hypothetical protein
VSAGSRRARRDDRPDHAPGAGHALWYDLTALDLAASRQFYAAPVNEPGGIVWDDHHGVDPNGA